MIDVSLSLPATEVRRRRGSIIYPASVLIGAEHDSIGYGFLTSGVSYLNDMLASLVIGDVTLRKVGNSGDSLGQMLAEINSGTCTTAPGQGVNPCFDLFPKAMNIAYIAGGTNDGPGDYAGSATGYRTMRSWVKAARAKGYDRIAAATIPSRGAPAAAIGGAVYDADTVLFNQYVRALGTSDLGLDLVIDLGGIAQFATRAAAAAAGVTGGPGDTGVGYTHPNADGYALMTPVAAAGFNALIAGQGGRTAPPATWSYIDLTDDIIALSNGNRTASCQAGQFGTATVQGFPIAASMTYWETVTDNPTNTLVGVTNESFQSLSPSNNMGQSPNGIALLTGYGGSVYYNSSEVLAGWESWGAGDVQQWCRRGSGLFVRKPGGLWNGSSSANPLTGAGAIDISGLGSGPLRPAAHLGAAPAQVASRFASTQQAGPVLTGFTSISA